MRRVLSWNARLRCAKTLRLRLRELRHVDEVAELLGISESGVYRLIRKGALTSVKVGGRTLFEPAAIREFISAQRRATDGLETESRRWEAA